MNRMEIAQLLHEALCWSESQETGAMTSIRFAWVGSDIHIQEEDGTTHVIKSTPYFPGTFPEISTEGV